LDENEIEDGVDELGGVLELVLNRLAETRVLTSWFQRPHRKYGTTYRTINLIALLQVLTIVLSRGNFYVLAALYAFGVVWSFSFNGLAVFILRFKYPEHREWKVPGNVKIGKREIPIGLGLITALLFLIAIANLVTKKEATIAGVVFSGVFYCILTVSERYAKREQAGQSESLEQFRVFDNPELDYALIGTRPGNILVTVRDPHRLHHLREVLNRTNTAHQDVVVLSARLSPGRHSFSGNTSYEARDVFDIYEQEPIVNGDHPFLKMPNVLCTPHLGWAEWDNFELYFRECFEQIVKFEKGEPLRLGNPNVKPRAKA